MGEEAASTTVSSVLTVSERTLSVVVQCDTIGVVVEFTGADGWDVWSVSALHLTKWLGNAPWMPGGIEEFMAPEVVAAIYQGSKVVGYDAALRRARDIVRATVDARRALVEAWTSVGVTLTAALAEANADEAAT